VLLPCSTLSTHTVCPLIVSLEIKKFRLDDLASDAPQFAITG
jgi:hypothetical protein